MTNPFFEPSTLPYSMPPFAEIEDGHRIEACGGDVKLPCTHRARRRRAAETRRRTLRSRKANAVAPDNGIVRE